MLQPYVLPHECEGADLTALLAGLTPRQRRVLRSYVWQVELGELTVTTWLAAPQCPVSRSKWYEGSGLYWGNAAFQRALAAYRKAGLEWSTNQERRSVEAAQRRIRHATPEAANRLVEHVQADVGQFFTPVERWTDEPLPSQQIIAEEMREDPVSGIKRRFCLVRYAALDLTKLADPRYSRLIRKFSDSPTKGLSIEMYDAQRAAESILDRADKGTASKGETTAVVDMGRFEDALRRAYGEDAAPDEAG